MAKNLIIIGASGDGRNVAEIVAEMSHEWHLLGFLDDDPKKQGAEINGIPVLGKIASIDMYADCYFVVLVGDPKDYFVKKRLVNRLGIDELKFATIIHPSAWVSRHASIGRGSVILPGVTIMANAEIGNHVFVASKTNIGHDTKIGDYVLISALAGISGNVVIEEGCYIGIGSSIREGVTIGKWSIVGMGSVVVSDVPPYHVVVGNPAKILRKLEPTKFQL